VSRQLIDLFNPVAEKVSLATRNLIDNNDGITIKFLVNVPGHPVGETITLAAAQARVFIKKNQAQAQV
jgi:hypothetical protein